MHNWIDRWQKRQRELAEGVDADLIHANRRRSRLALGAGVFGFLLLVIDEKLHLPTVLRTVLGTVAVGCLLLSIRVGRKPSTRS